MRPQNENYLSCSGWEELLQLSLETLETQSSRIETVKKRWCFSPLRRHESLVTWRFTWCQSVIIFWKLDNHGMESDFSAQRWWQGTFATKVAVRAIVTSDCHPSSFWISHPNSEGGKLWSQFPTWELMSHPLIHIFDSLQHCWIKSLSCGLILIDWKFPSTTATSFF